MGFERSGKIEVNPTFDTNLNSRYLPPLKAPAESVRDYTLFYQKKGKWIKILKVKDNYQRHRQHRFKPITTSHLRLEISATNGSPEAMVYEVRVYNSVFPLQSN